MENKEKITTADKNEYTQIMKNLEVFQICDSMFPIGTFNHSYGMETYLREHKVKDNDSFEKWLITFLQTQFKWGEGLAVRLCHEALMKGDIDKLWDYDQQLTLSAAAFETRKGARLIALQMIELILQIYPNEKLPTMDLIRQYKDRIEAGSSFGNPAIVFAMFMHREQLPVKDSVSYYGYSIVTTMVQNAVRAIPLGQKAGQRIMHDVFKVLIDICKDIFTMDESYLGANVPGIELAQIKHETTTFRLFMS